MVTKFFTSLSVFILLISCSSGKFNAMSFDSGPEIQGINFEEKYFDTIINDPYRNLENLDDTIVQQWLKEKSTHTTSIFKKIDGRDSLLKRMISLKGRSPFSIKNIEITDNGKYFFLKKNKKEKEYKLYYKAQQESEEELLFDPIDFKPETKKEYSINYIKPSWNGEYIVASLSYSGKELSEMIIINVDKKRILPQIITNCWPKSFLGVNWLPNNNSFTYLHFPVTDPSDEEFKKNTKSVLYTIGQDPSKLHVILGKDLNPELEIKQTDYLTTNITSQYDKYIIAYKSGVDNYWDAYYTEIENLKSKNVKWKILYKKENKVLGSSGIFFEDKFVYLSGENASNYRILSLDSQNLNFKKYEVLVEEKKDEVIDDFKINSDGLYYTTIKNGVEANLYKFQNKESHKIILPRKSGSIEMQNINIKEDQIWITIKGWINGSERYQHENDSFFKDDIYPEKEYPEFDNFEIEEVLVPSHDGVEVPLSIIYNKNIKKHGKNPVFMYGYGAYGDAINPSFSTVMLSWVLEGGVLCIAHVRGGGEKGDDWHKSGQKINKPNTWKDLIACTEYLIDKKFTSPKYTAIFSSSAGGIMIGRAVTERPDLFTVGICAVGMMNPLRHEARAGGGGSNYKEYGTIKDSLECMGLIEMDPYLHIKKNMKYPAMLLTAGMNDPRMPTWMPGKFVARLQNSDTKKPVLFDVDFNAGHNGGTSPREDWTNYFAFALWQMGHPDYQLKQE